MKVPAELQALAVDACPTTEDDWGSPRQIDAENLFFETAAKLVPEGAFDDFETMKASTEEMIVEALRRVAAEPSVLARAAETDDRDAAVKLITDALRLDPTSAACVIHMTWADRWRQHDREGRLDMIAGWLTAEAREARIMVDVPTPTKTVGTND